MRRVIVGTAGHIDHGKTKLVEAITGTDCDRWEEERQRGITIDLGFAHLTRDDLQLGFVDVPGHEKFLHNALAGLGGIRIVLLVIAGDEGIKPQTIEHLEVCSLLDIPRAAIAITKTDVAAADLVELVQLEVEELIADSPWPDARIFPVSSSSGDGIEELVGHLTDLAAELPEDDRPQDPVRLPVDRSFQLRGLGSIVTGTLTSGSIEVGQTLEALPGGAKAKVRSIQVHGEERPHALAGERTALQLAGISAAELERGRQLVSLDSIEASQSLLVELDLLAEAPVTLSGWTDVIVHVYSSEIVGKARPFGKDVVEPGARAVVELRLAAPTVAARGDRFIVRRPSPATTIGGGRILDPRWQRPHGEDRDRALEALAGSDLAAAGYWVHSARLHGLDEAELGRRLGCRGERARDLLSQLESEQKTLRLATGRGREPRWVTPQRFADLELSARALLTEYLKRERLAAGMPKAEALRRLMPGVAPEAAKVYLDWLEANGTLVVQGDLLNLPGREAKLSGEEKGLAADLLAAYEEAGLQPPAPREVATRLGAKPQIVDGVVHFLMKQGKLVKLSGDLMISRRAVDEARDELRASGLDDFTVGEFRDRFGLTRKWAIPLLEHFDSRRITHRLGDVRKMAPPGAER